MLSWSYPVVSDTASYSLDTFIYESSKQNLAKIISNHNSVTMYVCGITPYDATHIGHASTYIAFDMLQRQLLDQNIDVTYVQNVTDIDEPLLERAKLHNRNWEELALEQIQLFRDDMESLNIIPPTTYLGAVESIPLIIDFIKKLKEKNLIYKLENLQTKKFDTYLSINKVVEFFKNTTSLKDLDFWKLGNISNIDNTKMLEMFSDHGGDPERLGKENKLDPVLWISSATGNDPEWDGGEFLGTGRPGWHVKCAAIARKYLPKPFSIQGGGQDLIFPHHEMCSLLVSSLSQKPLANLYVHSGMVGFNGKKMSKSLGNLVLVSQLRKDNVDPRVIRLAILKNHYRDNWFWDDNLLVEAKDILILWKKAIEKIGNRYHPDNMKTITDIRYALSKDIDSPEAIKIVSHWANKILESKFEYTQENNTIAEVNTVAATLDSLLGIKI